MPRSPLTLLQKLEATRLEFGPGRATVKITLLTKLERSQLPTAEAILRLHEQLCFLRAYPDNAALFSQVVGMLKRFSQRADLHRYRADLADTGICGTVIHYSGRPRAGLSSAGQSYFTSTGAMSRIINRSPLQSRLSCHLSSRFGSAVSNLT